jgi:hypothetical protein
MLTLASVWIDPVHCYLSVQVIDVCARGAPNHLVAEPSTGIIVRKR